MKMSFMIVCESFFYIFELILIKIEILAKKIFNNTKKIKISDLEI